MALPLLSPRDPDWRLGPVASRRLLFAVTRSLAGQPSDGTRRAGAFAAAGRGAVVARPARRGRCLELVCAGDAGFDVVAALAPVVGRFGAELVVRSVPDTDDPAVTAALRRGGVVVWGSLGPTPRSGLVQVPV